MSGRGLRAVGCAWRCLSDEIFIANNNYVGTLVIKWPVLGFYLGFHFLNWMDSKQVSRG